MINDVLPHRPPHGFAVHKREPPRDVKSESQAMDAGHRSPDGMRMTRGRPSTSTASSSPSLLLMPFPSAPVVMTTTQTERVTFWATQTMQLPPFASPTPRRAADAYPNDRFGGEVLGVALGAAIVAIGITRLWHALRA